MSKYTKILLVIVLIGYILSPFDFIPDFFPILGWIDDLLVIIILGLLIYYFKYKKLPNFIPWGKRKEKTYSKDSARSNKRDWENSKKEEEERFNTEQTFDSSPKDPYKVLGLKFGASQREIQSAYKTLVQKFHPDKVSHLGKEFQDMAHKKFIEIQEAYEKLRVK